jgi:hypothetical protein
MVFSLFRMSPTANAARIAAAGNPKEREERETRGETPAVRPFAPSLPAAGTGVIISERLRKSSASQTVPRSADANKAGKS